MIQRRFLLLHNIPIWVLNKQRFYLQTCRRWIVGSTYQVLTIFQHLDRLLQYGMTRDQTRGICYSPPYQMNPFMML